MFVADYVLMEYGTGAIMAVPGHDSRDYEFAKAFDLPVERVIEGTDPEAARDEEGLPYPGDGPMVNSGRFDGKHNREAYDEIVEWLGSEGRGKSVGQLPPARLAGLAPALLGRADPGRLLRRVRDRSRCPTTSSRSSCPRSRTTRRRARARWPRPRTGSPPSARVRRPGPARDRHDGHLRRLLLVLHPLPRPAQRRGGLGPRRRRPLAAGRPVHRRRRARDPAPDVRALLHQGAGRPRPARRPGAVRQPLRAGDDHPRRGEDVEVEGQHGQPRPSTSSATAPTRPAPTSASWARPSAAATGPTRASRASTASSSRLWRLCEEVEERTDAAGEPGAAADGGGARAARQGALGDRQGDPGLRARLPVQHRDRRRDGAGQRRLPAQGRPLRRGRRAARRCASRPRPPPR